MTTLVFTALAQRADVSVVGGGGVGVTEETSGIGVTAVGASFGIPYSSRHRFQFDYLLNHFHGGSVSSFPANRHFFTASYVVQKKEGGTRPFFQVGAGLLHWSAEAYVPVGTGKALYLSDSDTSLAVVFGGGATIDLGKSLFIRPQVQVYGSVGPTVAIIPSVGFGWRF